MNDTQAEQIYWANWLLFLQDYNAKHPNLRDKHLLSKATTLYVNSHCKDYGIVEVSEKELFNRERLLKHFLKNRDLSFSLL